MTTYRITADLSETQARLLADKLMEGEHFLPVGAAGAFEGAPPVWRFEAWSNQSIDQSDFLNTARRLTNDNTLGGFQYQTVDDKDWVAKSLEDLPPVRAGRFVVFGAHDRHKKRNNEIAIEIEASLAFGTGHHPTTLGCLLELDRWCKTHRGKIPADKIAVLDIGTGTGILALAAAKALPLKAIASDLDPEAIRVAKRHRKLAGLDDKVQLFVANGTKHNIVQAHAPYPLVIANILAVPLVLLAADFAKVTARGGTIILSGLLNWQAQRVIATYLNAGFSLAHKRIIGDWTTLVLVKKIRTTKISKKTKGKSHVAGRKNAR
ncbi:MAG: 50S ribosomal protein L11 methyltransferase [Pseudomonadota bacterium]